MRRAFLGLVVAAFTVLALAGPASAASGLVTQFRFSGTFATAFWFTTSATSSTAADIDVSQSKQGSELVVDQIIDNLDANGNFTGETFTQAIVTSGFSFAIDSRLTSASASGSGLPATTCTLDANFNVIGCSATSIDVNVTWTGQGPIGRGVSVEHSKAGGLGVTSRFNGTSRTAAATGTIGGLTFSASAQVQAVLGSTKEGSTAVCVGNSC